jgi:hypothetical protein
MLSRATSMLVAGCVLLAIAASGAAARQDDRPETPLTALEVRAASPPEVVKGVDGRQHIEYDLIITNVFTTDVTLQSIEVLDGRGRHLTTLEGDALASVTTRIFGADPTVKVESSAAVQTVVDVVLPRGAEVPERLTHRVSYDFPKGALFEQLIGSHEVAGPTLEVQRRHEIVVSPPLRGSGWIAVNACCEPSSHRSFLLSANGGLVTPEVFAIDFIQTRDGRLAEGDGSQNEQWFGHGNPIFAAAGGTVVSTRDDMPEVPPGTGTTDNPTLKNATDFGGNHVLIRMRRGVYALYGHMIPGTVTVEPGERVETGEQLGRLGSSGNTSAPHLHFGLIDGRGLLSSDSLPFVIDRFTYGGQATVSETGDVTITGTPHAVSEAHPLSNSIADFAP